MRTEMDELVVNFCAKFCTDWCVNGRERCEYLEGEQKLKMLDKMPELRKHARN